MLPHHPLHSRHYGGFDVFILIGRAADTEKEIEATTIAFIAPINGVSISSHGKLQADV